MQWCLPFRRQHAEGAVPVIPKANGARKLQTATESTKRATVRRISLHANTSQPYVTNEPPRTTRRAGELCEVDHICSPSLPRIADSPDRVGTIVAHQQ